VTIAPTDKDRPIRSLIALERLRDDMNRGFVGIEQRCERLLATMRELRNTLERISGAMATERLEARRLLDEWKD
jgi:hypothetical protein